MDNLDDLVKNAIQLNNLTMKMQDTDHLLDNILQTFAEDELSNAQMITIQNSILAAYNLGLN